MQILAYLQAVLPMDGFCFRERNMLNLRQIDSIVHSTLRIFKGFEIQRREDGTFIFYDVHDNPESGRRFLGTYQVWEWHDGSGRCDWVPLDTNDPDIERVRHMVWEAIMAIAVPANQDNQQSAELEVTTHQEDMYLSCDKRAFRTWFESQYPLHAKNYRDTPDGATFSINLTQFEFAYLPGNGQHKYLFTIKAPKRFSKIRDEFISTLHNTFFDPPHYERKVHGKADEIIQFIEDFVKNDGVDLSLKNAFQGKGLLFDFLEFPQKEHWSIFVRRYDANEKYEPREAVILFKFVEDTVNNRVLIRMDCYSHDPAIIEYFNLLRERVIEPYPAADGEQPQVSAATKKKYNLDRIRKYLPPEKTYTDEELIKSLDAIDNAKLSPLDLSGVYQIPISAKLAGLQREIEDARHQEILDAIKQVGQMKDNAAQNGAARSEVKALPRIPKQTKRLNDWKAVWRKVKGRWRGGSNYRELAQLANISPETIADIVKAGDAGLLD